MIDYLPIWVDTHHPVDETCDAYDGDPEEGIPRCGEPGKYDVRWVDGSLSRHCERHMVECRERFPTTSFREIKSLRTVRS